MATTVDTIEIPAGALPREEPARESVPAGAARYRRTNP